MLSICFDSFIKLSKHWKTIQKEQQKLSLLLINSIGKKYFQSHKKYWENFELNNKSIALNILYVPYNTEEIKIAYISKHYSKHKNQVIILMVADNEK